MDYYKTLNLYLYLCVVDLVSLRTNQSRSAGVNSFIKHIFFIQFIYLRTYSYQGKIYKGEENRFAITRIHVVAVLRGKIALHSYFRGRE